MDIPGFCRAIKRDLPVKSICLGLPYVSPNRSDPWSRPQHAEKKARRMRLRKGRELPPHMRSFVLLRGIDGVTHSLAEELRTANGERRFVQNAWLPRNHGFQPPLRVQHVDYRIASLTGLPTRLSISTSVSMVNLAVFLFTTSDTRGRETIRISAASACFK